jgi:hypothetical protein
VEDIAEYLVCTLIYGNSGRDDIRILDIVHLSWSLFTEGGWAACFLLFFDGNGELVKSSGDLLTRVMDMAEKGGRVCVLRRRNCIRRLNPGRCSVYRSVANDVLDEGCWRCANVRHPMSISSLQNAAKAASAAITISTVSFKRRSSAG